MDNIKQILYKKNNKYTGFKQGLKFLLYLFNAILMFFAVLNFRNNDYLLFSYVLLSINFILIVLFFVFSLTVRKYYDKISTEYEYLYHTDNNFIKSELTNLYKISIFNKILIYLIAISNLIMILSLII